jgi:hypothetical protein
LLIWAVKSVGVKSQARKNPKEFNFAWGFSVFVVPGEGIELLSVGFVLAGDFRW